MAVEKYVNSIDDKKTWLSYSRVLWLVRAL